MKNIYLVFILVFEIITLNCTKCGASPSFEENFMMAKKVLCAFPPKMLEEIDAIAQSEHRSRSDYIREACRRYNNGAKKSRTLVNPPLIVDANEIEENTP